MPESFGARMREQRERQQIALSTIAEQTKIKVSLLEALERDDVSHWPSGIFRRAFVRAYAHAIGLEPDLVLREFLELHPDPPEVIADALANGSDDGRASDGAPTRFKFLVASAIGSVSRLRARTNHKSDGVFEPGASIPKMIVHVAAPLPKLMVRVDPPPPVETHAIVAPEPTVRATPSVAEEQTDSEQADPVLPDAEPQTPPETVVAAQASSSAPARYEPDLMAVAHLCTELGCVQTTADVPPLLHEMTRLLDAVGVIVWLWDPIANELRPALAHGYSDHVVAQLPRVERDTNNATAAAFRASRTCVVKGDHIDNGALAVPLIGPGGCVGVLAIELAERKEEHEWVRARAMIFAAQLAALLGTAQPMEASDRRLA